MFSHLLRIALMACRHSALIDILLATAASLPEGMVLVLQVCYTNARCSMLIMTCYPMEALLLGLAMGAQDLSNHNQIGSR